jgi:hypothetical protein
VHQPRIAAEAAAARDAFQKHLRNTLRAYRAGLEDALHGLRDSNASMRASLRAFSEGGNFCAEEIDEYRGIMQALSSKIDAIEGSITSELDGLEAAHTSHSDEALAGLQVAQAVAAKDAAFVEDGQRRVRAAAVKIKAELASSDARAAELVALVTSLDTAIDPWKGADVIGLLSKVSAGLAARIAYLDGSRAAAGALNTALAAAGAPALHSAVAPSQAAAQPVAGPAESSAGDREETNGTPRLRTGGAGLRPEDAFDRWPAKKLDDSQDRGSVKRGEGRKGAGRAKVQLTLPHGYRLAVDGLMGGSPGSLLAATNDIRTKTRQEMLEAAAAFYHELQRSPRALTRPDIRDTIQNYAENVQAAMGDLLKPVLEHRTNAIAALLALCKRLQQTLMHIPEVAFAAIGTQQWASIQRVRACAFVCVCVCVFVCVCVC